VLAVQIGHLHPRPLAGNAYISDEVVPVGVHPDLLLLSALRQRPAHGYTTIEELRRRSGGTFDLAEGTIYPALTGSSTKA
jgi:hypothetical protein